jgi:hypothetical protein
VDNEFKDFEIALELEFKRWWDKHPNHTAHESCEARKAIRIKYLTGQVDTCTLCNNQVTALEIYLLLLTANKNKVDRVCQKCMNKLRTKQHEKDINDISLTKEVVYNSGQPL